MDSHALGCMCGAQYCRVEASERVPPAHWTEPGACSQKDDTRVRVINQIYRLNDLIFPPLQIGPAEARILTPLTPVVIVTPVGHDKHTQTLVSGSLEGRYGPVVITEAKQNENDIELKHVCTMCGASYKWLGSVQRHVRIIHEGGGGLKCNLCNVPFADRTKLLKHLRKGARDGKCTRQMPNVAYIAPNPIAALDQIRELANSPPRRDPEVPPPQPMIYRNVPPTPLEGRPGPAGARGRYAPSPVLGMGLQESELRRTPYPTANIHYWQRPQKARFQEMDGSWSPPPYQPEQK